ncbi:MAG: hypothetical protein JNK78_07835 [Planctomycetes bacterium]|nr:hypothetical protein [Planctomycetota bacterium]
MASLERQPDAMHGAVVLKANVGLPIEGAPAHDATGVGATVPRAAPLQ